MLATSITILSTVTASTKDASSLLALQNAEQQF